MATNLTNLENNNFGLNIEITSDGKVTKTLKTADTYVDRNIQIDVEVADASYEVKADNAVTATVSTADTTYLTDSETGFAIEMKAEAAATKATVGVKNAGYAAATDTVEVTAKTATPDVKTKYIKAGALADPSALTMNVEGGNGVDVTVLGAAPENGFYIKTTAGGKVEVGTSGWIPAETKKDVAGEAFYSIPTLTLGNAGVAEAIYTDISETAPVLVSGDFLYINEGYIENSKISLAKLVPDKSNVAGKNDLVYKTVSVYDNDGQLVAGSMQDAELSAITASDASAEFTTVTVAANADSSAFNVTGAANISGTASVAISKTGYATTSLSQTGNITGEATVNASIAKVALAADKTTDGAVKPVLKKETSTALSGAISTTAPTGKYVAVSADAIAQTVTVSPKVATEGYGTTSVFDKTDVTVTGGSEATGTYYVAINDGSHAVSHTQEVTQEAIAINMAATVSETGYSISGVSAVEPTGVPYITISTSNTTTAGSVTSQATCEATEGYILTGTDSDTAKTTAIAAQVTQAANKYIKVYTGEVL